VLFNFQNQVVRVIVQDGQPWFVAADVGRGLGVVNNRDALSSMPSDEKGVTIGDTLGGPQRLSVVSEAGLYRLIFASRKESARAFKRWVHSPITHRSSSALGIKRWRNTRRQGRISPDAISLRRVALETLM
jgi:prophage antirepressor-like protein